MKLLIFGGTGPAGRLLVQQAIDAGHDVSVYVRDGSKLGPLSKHVRVVTGTLTDGPGIDAAVQGQDAVVSLLGPKGRSTGLPISDGMGLIVAAMRRHGVRRLIATATPSASDPQDRFQASFWLAVLLVRALLGPVYQDIVRTAQIVRDSGLEWTLVRLPMLSDEAGSGPVHAGYLGQRGARLFSLSRNALATFLLDQLKSDQWLRRAPVVCNA